MPRGRLAAAGLALAGLVGLVAGSAWAAEATLSVATADSPRPRIGLNLGHRTAWGAEQLVANVLRNPGLEPGQDGALVVVGQVARGTLVDDSVWQNRREGFWTGARFTVLTGPDAGLTGQVMDSHAAQGAQREPTRFLLQPPPGAVRVQDVVAVQGLQEGASLPLWWTQGLVKALPGQGRPGSPGSQAARLVSSSLREAALVHHLDGITGRAGKLLAVQGPWLFAVWARSVTPGATLQVRFRRHGTAPWLEHTWTPGPTWQELRLPFNGRDAGPAAALELSLSARGGQVDVDDVYLGEAQPGPGGFRQATVTALKALRPGYLRDWQGQLGDSVANRLAPPLARQPSRYRPGEHDWQFHYSVQELAELAAAVGARPWLVLPATATPAQARAFGEALRELQRRLHFDELVVEYGNEHWNALFRAAGIANPALLAEAASALFQALREGAGPETPLHLVLGGQFVRPELAPALTGGRQAPDGIAVAPYFAYKMARTQSVDDMVAAALDEGDEPFKAWAARLPKATALDVYEVHAHTTLGDAPEALRARWALSPGVGVALARRLLQAAAHGVTRQAVYALSGFDTPVDGAAAGLVPLFGITRDLLGPVNLRPGGEALAALNALDWSRSASARCAGAGCAALTARFFAAGTQLAVVSAARHEQALAWPCPPGGGATWQLRWLSAQGAPAAAWRETRVSCRDGQARWTLPAFTVAVMKRP